MSRNLVFLLIFVIALGFWKNQNKQTRVNTKNFSEAAIAASSCENKNFCAVIYMAPWCPHCRDALGETQTILSRVDPNGNLGIRVIVGAGTKSTNEEMAREIARGAETDDDAAIAHKLSIRAFPTYLVFDKEGSIILTGQEAHFWLLQKYGLAAI